MLCTSAAAPKPSPLWKVDSIPQESKTDEGRPGGEGMALPRQQLIPRKS